MLKNHLNVITWNEINCEWIFRPLVVSIFQLSKFLFQQKSCRRYDRKDHYPLYFNLVKVMYKIKTKWVYSLQNLIALCSVTYYISKNNNTVKNYDMQLINHTFWKLISVSCIIQVTPKLHDGDFFRDLNYRNLIWILCMFICERVDRCKAWGRNTEKKLNSAFFCME